jgi:16S rRNA (guanine(966)-N(2))-methyltransferase RsmD
MRIISGKFKAKRINGPKTEKVRPTLDRVKEALFSIIDEYINNGAVLDLFAGTGNLSIEALSRGAKFAWINDIENTSISTIISNIKLTNTKDCVKITKKDYIKVLDQIQKDGTKFDVVFLDPPYDSKYGIKSLEYISNSNDKILKKDGIIIYETDKNFISKIEKENINTCKSINVLENFENLICVDTRNYGNIVLKIYRWR